MKRLWLILFVIPIIAQVDGVPFKLKKGAQVVKVKPGDEVVVRLYKENIFNAKIFTNRNLKSSIYKTVNFEEGIFITDNARISFSDLYSISQMFLNVDGEAVMPTEYVISKAYPNPFNPVTNIDITVPQSGLMQFAIYDILGRQVFKHKQTFANPGHYRFTWSGKNNYGSSLASGVYLLTVRFAENYYKQKITLLK